MPISLLDSQLSLLEPLSSDESGITLDLAAPAHDIVEAHLAAASRLPELSKEAE